ncbi:unnamed protein product [Kluyveromyces dobzhanskii CBS 2104]|uniref:WGS project CCBQ000000000 data, contig 00011 n=1 Tax=Kluyveromyces dobzhanskii CBS 2104 TaxID=1427455 RepID=A0A0A8L7Q0_9SACH|nr:unnamed protein product [Kluyveromyces dobzhanskii CBS 2104]
MGNVPGKIDGGQETVSRKQHRSESLNLGSQGPKSVNRSRRATSLVGNLLSASGRARSDSYNSSGLNGNSSNPYKKKSTKEKERFREKHARQLVVKYTETVDGGFLAPFGCYSFDKLDYDADVVKGLIIDRKLAPFYTPLQDFDESWTREEVLKIVDGLPLHSSFQQEPEEFEGVPIGDLNDEDFDYLLDPTASKREQRRQRSKISRARLYFKRVSWQERSNEHFLELKLLSRRQPEQKIPTLPSNDLKYTLYKNGAECPICFLYFPMPLNVSGCCKQPICSECFVQIKRAPPHFPHDEVDPTQDEEPDEMKDPNLLVSEPANCPYCAISEFGVTYEPRKDMRTGINGMHVSEYKAADSKDCDGLVSDSSSNEGEEIVAKEQTRRGSIAADDPSVVTSDSIRPDWEINLIKERLRLARKSAKATAIHMSNQLIDPEHPSRHASVSSSVDGRDCGSSPQRRQKTLDELDDEMIQQAIKLSLQEH